MRKYWLFVVIGAITILSFAPKKGLDSSVYDWEKLPSVKIPEGEEKRFFKSPTRSLDVFEIKAVTLYPGNKDTKLQIENICDELIIVKDGIINIHVNGEQKILGEGSVIVVSSGDEVYISNRQNTNAVYFLVGFKPFLKDSQKGASEHIHPVFIDWKDVEFIPSANGGRRNIMQQKTSFLKELEIHVTTLKQGLPSHSAHTHPDEEIILVRKGFVEETIKGKPFRLGPGSLIFLTNDDLHGITNAGTGECEYYAIRWLTE